VIFIRWFHGRLNKGETGHQLDGLREWARLVSWRPDRDSTLPIVSSPEGFSMLNRREFQALTIGALAFGPAAAASARAKDEPKADATWLTYAVNVEMFWSSLPFPDRLREVAKAGFTHYEFWPWRTKDIAAIVGLNKELGLTPVQFTASPRAFNRGIADPARKGEFLEDVRAAIPIARRLGVKLLTVVAGEEPAGVSKEVQTAAVIEALKEGAPIAEEAGVTLILEPLNVLVDHPKQHVVTSEHAAKIMHAVGSPAVKILFDVYHQQISEGNLIGNIHKYKDVIGYYQIADHPGRNEPGTGEINYANVLRAIHETGYRGAIGLELSPKADPASALRAVRDADSAARVSG
jgi:hydroxypyruvate isomerase